MASTVTRSRIHEVLWRWRRFARGETCFDLDAPGAVWTERLRWLERELDGALRDQGRRGAVAAGFFGVCRATATQIELAEEFQLSVRSLQAAINGAVAAVDQVVPTVQFVDVSGDALGCAVDELSRAEALRGAVRAFSRVESRSRDSSLLARGLLCWLVRNHPAQVTVGEAVLAFSSRTERLRALRRAEVAVLLAAVPSPLPAPLLVGRDRPDVAAFELDGGERALDAFATALEQGDTAVAAILRGSIDEADLDLQSRQRYRSLTWTLQRLVGDPRVARHPPDVGPSYTPGALIDSALAFTYAAGDPWGALRLLEREGPRCLRDLPDSVRYEADLHLRLARGDAAAAMARAESGSLPVSAWAHGRRVLAEDADAAELLSDRGGAPLEGAPVGTGTDPTGVRLGLERRRTEMLRLQLRICERSGHARRREAIEENLADVAQAVVSQRTTLRDVQVPAALEAELGLALELPHLAPRSASEILGDATDLHAARPHLAGAFTRGLRQLVVAASEQAS